MFSVVFLQTVNHIRQNVDVFVSLALSLIKKQLSLFKPNCVALRFLILTKMVIEVLDYLIFVFDAT